MYMKVAMPCVLLVHVLLQRQQTRLLLYMVQSVYQTCKLPPVPSLAV